MCFFFFFNYFGWFQLLFYIPKWLNKLLSILATFVVDGALTLVTGGWKKMWKRKKKVFATKKEKKKANNDVIKLS